MKNFFEKIWKWIRKDGALHIGVSALIYIVSALIFMGVGALENMFAFAAIITLAFGFGKEIVDSLRNGQPIDTHDIICDFIGIFIGTIITLAITAIVL